MNPKADPQAQALAILRAELNDLQARNLAPSEQAAIGRMIEEQLVLGTVFSSIWKPDHIRPHYERGGYVWLAEPVPGWPECYTPERFTHEVDLERRRLLQVIIGTAATVPQLAADRRKASRELPALFDDFGKLALAMSTKLEEIRHHAHAGGLSLPGWLSDPVELMTEAAAEYGPDSFDLIARPDLEALAIRYARHLPDLQTLLDFLAITGKKTAHATPRFYEFTRQSNPIGDYTRTLLEALARYWNVAVYLQPFEFTAPELLDLAAVMTGTDPDELPKDLERGIRAILREHRGG